MIRATQYGGPFTPFLCTFFLIWNTSNHFCESRANHHRTLHISWHSPVKDRHFLTQKLTYLLIMIWDIKEKKTSSTIDTKLATVEKYFPGGWVWVVWSTGNKPNLASLELGLGLRLSLAKEILKMHHLCYLISQVLCMLRKMSLYYLVKETLTLVLNRKQPLSDKLL